MLFTGQIYGQEVLIQTDYLNVRSGPATDYEKVTQVHNNEKYPVIQKQNNWVEIELKDGTGWVMMDYITIVDVSEVGDQHTNLEDLNDVDDDFNIVISNDNTHIRNEPSTNGNIIGYVNKGTELLVVSENDEWYGVNYEDQEGYISKNLIDHQISFSNKFEDRTFVIDAGHGGHDTGATSVKSGFHEKDFAFMTTSKLQQTLSLLGAEVLLTRDNDDYVRLGSRPALANLHDTDAFISIHYNSFPDMPSVTGIGTYYFDDYNKSLAKSIQKNLVLSTNATDRGITYDNLLVLRHSYKPSVLLELGFISNEEKEELLLTDHYQSKLVHGIVTGLSTYLTSEEINENKEIIE